MMTVETVLGIKLPGALVKIYAEGDGLKMEERIAAQSFRLMPLAELVTINTQLRRSGIEDLLRAYSMACFWTDDQSNYAGVFCGGIFEGRVFFVDHDGPFTGDLSPVFRTVDSFLEAANESAERNRIIGYFEAGEITFDDLSSHASRFPWYRHYAPGDTASWFALPLDYRSGEEAYTALDREAYTACTKKLEAKIFASDGERDLLVCSQARLVPPNESHTLLPYLKEDNMWLPGRVAQILVQRDCPDAVAPLVTLALTGNYNCRSTAKYALVKMGIITPQAQGAIKAEYSRQGGDYTEIKATMDAYKKSPSLYYQW